MRKHARILYLLLLGLASPVCAQQAAIIWSEHHGSGTRVYESRYETGQWQSKELIFADGQLNILPALGLSRGGRRLAVWVTVDGAHSALKYSFDGPKGWGAPRILTEQMRTNLAPALVYDRGNTPWVFWSANDGADDDIYVSRWRSGGWSAPEPVHDANTVPDVLPEAGVDAGGNVWVAWQTLSNNTYIEKTRVYDGSTGASRRSARDQARRNPLADQERLRADVPLPAFYRGNSRSTLVILDDQRSVSIPVDRRQP